MITARRTPRPSLRLAVCVGALGVALAAIVAASAVAATIQGTARADTLRGTAKADKIYGKGGNDKLFGLGGADYLNGGPGNDVVAGGPGADVLACGTGKDTATADVADKVAADCETVTGLPKPAMSVASASQAEGNAGNQAMSFTVTLAKASVLKVTASYATADGTATAGSDFTATNGTVSFAPGETSKSISVPIIGETTVEADETFSVTLSSPVNAVLGTATATGTITNDDVAPPAQPGHYGGFNNVGGSVQFDVQPDGSTLTNVVITYKASCQPAATLNSGVTFGGVVPILPDKTFTLNGTGTGLTMVFKGTFGADGASVSGTIQIHRSLDNGGVHYECDTGAATWSATRQG